MCRMDAMHWNTTLRTYSQSSPNSIEDYSDFNNCGLVALDISDNQITDMGLESLCRALERNQWILGIMHLIVCILTHCNIKS
jgi:hypothetical protein